MNNMMNNIKKMTAGLLAVGLIVAGIVVAPKQADATGTVNAATVICEAYEESIIKANYWKTDGSKIAPLKSNYVFGGWFQQSEDEMQEILVLNGVEGYYKPLSTEEMTNVMNDTTNDTLYAKFVPAQVLSVKAQNSANVTSAQTAAEISTTNPMYIRLISSMDSTNYQTLGFEIYLANKTKATNSVGGACETDKYYDGIYEGEYGQGNIKSAESIFGAPSEKVFVWQLSKIDTPSNVSKIIYARPYWITMDGTKVEGLAKYVHIEDQYLNLISVPVNLLTGEMVAAGTLQMTYDTDLTLYGCEAGRLLPSMRFWHDTANNTIHMVGNATTKDTDVSADGIFANIRFKKPEGTTDFVISSLQFSDWQATQVIEIEKVWNVKYEVSASTDE